jgi:dipeptidyl aminopeptidase/acylaminoacyl peptidase
MGRFGKEEIMKERLLVSFISLFLLTFLPSCGQSDAQHDPKNPIQGKIIFESNREALKDAIIGQDGFKKGILSLYLWENGKITKFFKGGSHPRWSPDGERIACVRWGTGNIAILDANGNILQEIKPTHYALRVDWFDDNSIFYVGEERSRSRGQMPTAFLMKYDLSVHEDVILYKTVPLGRISNVSFNKDGDIFIFHLDDKLKRESELSTYVVFFDSATKSLNVVYKNAFDPVLLDDGRNILFTTNWTPDGRKIEQFGWGALVKYNLETKDFDVIRPTSWVRNMRLSRDGKYLYTSEPVERDGNAIHIYSVENLKRPIYVIPPATIYGYNDFSHDLNPDWLPFAQPESKTQPRTEGH